MAEDSNSSEDTDRDIKEALRDAVSSVFYVFLEVMFNKDDDDS